MSKIGHIFDAAAKAKNRKTAEVAMENLDRYKNGFYEQIMQPIKKIKNKKW